MESDQAHSRCSVRRRCWKVYRPSVGEAEGFRKRSSMDSQSQEAEGWMLVFGFKKELRGVVAVSLEHQGSCFSGFLLLNCRSSLAFLWLQTISGKTWGGSCRYYLWPTPSHKPSLWDWSLRQNGSSPGDHKSRTRLRAVSCIASCGHHFKA